MAKDKKVEQITDMEQDFAQWFTDVCTKGQRQQRTFEAGKSVGCLCAGRNSRLDLLAQRRERRRDD